MAIERVYFSSVKDDQMEPFYNWLINNASEYFDSVTYDSATKKVTCSFGNGAYFSYGKGSKSCINLKTNKNITTYDSGEYIKYIMKTEKGFMIVLYSYYGDNVLCFSKSNEGATVVSVMHNTSSSYTSFRLDFADMKNSIDFVCFLNSNTTERARFSMHASMTTLSPVCFDCDTYAPDMFYTPFSQYNGYVGIIEVDGVKYAYDGAIALKE